MERRCVVCGEPLGKGRRTLCGDPVCQETRKRSMQRVYYAEHKVEIIDDILETRARRMAAIGRSAHDEQWYHVVEGGGGYRRGASFTVIEMGIMLREGVLFPGMVVERKGKRYWVNGPELHRQELVEAGI